MIKLWTTLNLAARINFEGSTSIYDTLTHHLTIDLHKRKRPMVVHGAILFQAANY
jgi:hypothetical protein